MSFFKKLFGSGEKAEAGDKVLGEESYKGFTIKALHMPIGSEMQLAGVIEKEVGGELKTYRYVRADRISNREDLVTIAFRKGRQIIDEQGEKIFS